MIAKKCWNTNNCWRKEPVDPDSLSIGPSQRTLIRSAMRHCRYGFKNDSEMRPPNLNVWTESGHNGLKNDRFVPDRPNTWRVCVYIQTFSNEFKNVGDASDRQKRFKGSGHQIKTVF